MASIKLRAGSVSGIDDLLADISNRVKAGAVRGGHLVEQELLSKIDNWSSPPAVTVEVEGQGLDHVSVLVRVPKVSFESMKFWKTNDGAAYTISAKSPRGMSFNVGYDAKTPAGGGRGSGESFGFKAKGLRQVEHEVAPRGFVEDIQNDDSLKQRVIAEIRNSI